jgi:hypothetical protein
MFLQQMNPRQKTVIVFGSCVLLGLALAPRWKGTSSTHPGSPLEVVGRYPVFDPPEEVSHYVRGKSLVYSNLEIDGARLAIESNIVLVISGILVCVLGSYFIDHGLPEAKSPDTRADL